MKDYIENIIGTSLYKVEDFNLTLQDFHEVSQNKDSIPLQNSILFIEKIQFVGVIYSLSQIPNRNFLNIISRGKKIDLKDFISVKNVSSNVYMVCVEIPNFHNSDVKFLYNTSNFILDTIFTAYAKCKLVTPQN